MKRFYFHLFTNSAILEKGPSIFQMNGEEIIPAQLPEQFDNNIITSLVQRYLFNFLIDLGRSAHQTEITDATRIRVSPYRN